MAERIAQLRENASLIAPEASRLWEFAAELESQLLGARVQTDVTHTLNPATDIDRLRWMPRSGAWALAYRVTREGTFRFLDEAATEDPRVLRDIVAALDGLVMDIDTVQQTIKTDLGL